MSLNTINFDIIVGLHGSKRNDARRIVILSEKREKIERSNNWRININKRHKKAHFLYLCACVEVKVKTTIRQRPPICILMNFFLSECQRKVLRNILNCTQKAKGDIGFGEPAEALCCAKVWMRVSWDIYIYMRSQCLLVPSCWAAYKLLLHDFGESFKQQVNFTSNYG